MTHRQAKREIEALGFRIHSVIRHSNATGVIAVRYEARKDKILAKGDLLSSEDEAMSSCYRAVLGKVYA